MWIKVSPIHVNKWHFYMNKFNVSCTKSDRSESKICNEDALSFSWFSVGSPCKNKFGDLTLRIDTYTSLFDESTGKTYHITFDSTEVKPCVLKIVDVLPNKNKIILNDDYKGFAMCFAKNIKCDLVCTEVNILIKREILEESKFCPYINYAKTHAIALRREFKNFPSDEELQKAKPGKMSIILCKMLRSYF